MALETRACCASWLGNNLTLLTCCHRLIINNNNYHVRHSALSFTKRLNCDGWKCSRAPGPRASQPQGASRWALISPGAAAATCSPRGSAGGAGRSVLRDAPPASPHAARLRVCFKLRKGTGGLQGARKALASCSWRGRGAASCAWLSQAARTFPSPRLHRATASWHRAPAAGGEGLPRALHRALEAPGQGRPVLCIARRQAGALVSS